jgi:DNA-binding NarL/FixJ family response regulator
VIRTLVCASSELARAGLAAIVRGDTRLALVGEATPANLVASVATYVPDVLLEDRDLDHATLAVPSVALVDDPRAAWIGERLDAAARGPHAILARDAVGSEIVAAIVAVAHGLIALAPRALVPGSEVLPALGGDDGVAASDERRASGERVTADDGDAGSRGYEKSERLTARERDVLAELARGVPNKTIAARLAISEHTVKFHVTSIFAKLAVSSRTEAVTQGVRLGLIML